MGHFRSTFAREVGRPETRDNGRIHVFIQEAMAALHKMRPSEKFSVSALALAAGLLLSSGSAGANYEAERVVKLANARAITPMPDGSIWLLARDRAARNDPRLRAFRIDQLGKITRVALARPNTKRANVGAVVAGPDGAAWVAVSDIGDRRRSMIYRYTLAGKRLTANRLPTGTRVSSMAPGPDGRVWLLSVGADALGRVSASGRMARVSLPNARSYTQLAQGSDGAMWVVRKGAATRIGTGFSRARIGTPNQGAGAIGITRGSDGRMWVGAPGAFKWISPSGRNTGIVKLSYEFGAGGGGDTSESKKRYPISATVRADGLLGFIAASLLESRDSLESGPLSFGAVEPSEIVSETQPGSNGLKVFEAPDFEFDPMDAGGRFGVARMAATPNGKLWVLGRDAPLDGAIQYSLDRTVPLVAGTPIIASIRRTRGVLTITMSCSGSPGKFCAGSLSLQRSGKTVNRSKRYVLKPGDLLRVRLNARGPISNGKYSVLATAGDPTTGEVDRVTREVKAD